MQKKARMKTMSDMKELKNNLEILEMHTRTHRPVKVLTNGAKTETQLIYEVFERVNDLLNKDIVPVVRCRECKHFITNINKENYCDIHSTRWDKFYVNENEYCSRGEKR